MNNMNNSCMNNRYMGNPPINRRRPPEVPRPTERPIITQTPVMDKKCLMAEIYKTGFAMTETVLYLDTHPSDDTALNYYNDLKRKHHEFMRMYEKSYGPLLSSNVTSDNYWSWVATPMPWETEDC